MIWSSGARYIYGVLSISLAVLIIVTSNHVLAARKKTSKIVAQINGKAPIFTEVYKEEIPVYTLPTEPDFNPPVIGSLKIGEQLTLGIFLNLYRKKDLDRDHAVPFRTYFAVKIRSIHEIGWIKAEDIWAGLGE